MAYVANLKYLTLLDNNLAVQTIGVTGTPGSGEHQWTATWTSLPGQDTAMLDDDDATSLCKATSNLTSPILQIRFGNSQAITAFGICNHNLYSAGTTGLHLERSDNGSTWTAIDSTPYSVISDRDIAVAFAQENHTYFRMRMTDAGGGITPFYIGYVYWGTRYQFNRNPTQFIQTRRPAIRYLQSAGGMTHAIKGMEYRPATLEMNFVRSPRLDAQELATPLMSRYISGVIPPEAVTGTTLAPVGNDIFYGRLEEISVDPQTPSNITLSNEVYNMQVLMRGAV